MELNAQNSYNERQAYQFPRYRSVFVLIYFLFLCRTCISSPTPVRSKWKISQLSFSPYKPHLSNGCEHLVPGDVAVAVLVITLKSLSDLLLVLVLIVQFLFEDPPLVQELLHSQALIPVILTGPHQFLHMRTFQLTSQ